FSQSSYTICLFLLLSFFFTATAPTEIYTLSLHDALPISVRSQKRRRMRSPSDRTGMVGAVCPSIASPGPKSEATVRREEQRGWRSEEHTSELQSRFDLVCRLLLEKKKKNIK